MNFTKHAQSFADHLQTYLPQEISRSSGLLQAVKDELIELEKLAALETCLKRIEKLKLPLSPEHLRERPIFLDEKRILIVGARFKALNPEFPFVQAMANFPVDANSLSEIRALVQKEFGPLRPKGVVINQAPGLNVGAETWGHVLFGSTHVHSESKLRFHWPRRFGHYDLYRSEYEKSFQKSPHLRGIVRIEDETDLQTAASEGLLMEVSDDSGKFLGLVAAQASPYYGLRAIYIFELFLVPEVQGQKLAPETQRAFLKQLGGVYPAVWGHISSVNLPSLRTAQSVGRKIIQSEYYFPLTR